MSSLPFLDCEKVYTFPELYHDLYINLIYTYVSFLELNQKGILSKYMFRF